MSIVEVLNKLIISSDEYKAIYESVKYDPNRTHSLDYPAFTMELVGPMGVRFSVEYIIEIGGRDQEISVLKPDGSPDYTQSVIDRDMVILGACLESPAWEEACKKWLHHYGEPYPMSE